MFKTERSRRGTIETVVLRDDERGARLELAPSRGGILVGARVRGVELLYLDEATLVDSNKNVRGGVPILFPNAGRPPGPNCNCEGKIINLGQHGFAREMPWELGGDDQKITVVLKSNDATRAAFPFDFAFRVTYAIVKDSLSCATELKNTGGAPMPVHYGFHPYLRVENTMKRSARIEAVATRAFDNKTGEVKEYAAPSFGEGEVDCHILDPSGGGVRLRFPDAPEGAPAAIRLDYGAFPCVVAWTLPDKEYICLEPWTAPGRALATGEGLAVLKPGACDWRMWFLQPEFPRT